MSTGRSKERDARAIAHHYDVSNEFYALFLDPLMVYTCAYYRDPDGKLEQAQEDKLDLVCRKLRLQPGETRARHRLRLGRLQHLGRPALRRARPRRDALEGAGRLGGRADRARGARRTGAGSSTATSATCPRTRATTRSPPIGVIEHVGIPNYPAFFGRRAARC